MDSFLETLKNFGAGRLAVMLMTFFALVIFFIFIAVKSSAPMLTMMYANLSTTDSTEIAAKLDTANISYRLSEDGTKVSVSQKDIGRARMMLAAEGLPRHGSVGYEIFDQKQSFGITSFQQNINALRALEGELSSTIGTIDQVKNARVHLVLPQRELFSRESRPASASVFLNLRSTSIGSEQIRAIQHLVAAAVPQLKSSHVAVIDQSGNLLAKGEDDGDSSSISATNGADLRQKYELRLTRSIEDMVGRIVGYGKVRATVTADLNFDVISTNSEKFDPEQQVVRSSQTVSEENIDNSGAGTSNSVSVQNNLPGLPNNAAGDSAGASAGIRNNRTEEITNYEIGKTIENLVRESGQVQKQSIAVLVDGRYETDTTATKPEDADKDWAPPRKYIPRSQDELDKIETLVKSAVGFDADRGDTIQLINMRFAESEIFSTAALKEDTLMGFPKAAILDMAETLSLSMVAVLIVLLVLKPLVSHFSSVAAQSLAERKALAQEEMNMLLAQKQAQLGPPGAMPAGGQGHQPSELETMIDMGSVEGRVKASSVQKISELVTSHPNETVSVIRQWMSQES